MKETKILQVASLLVHSDNQNDILKQIKYVLKSIGDKTYKKFVDSPLLPISSKIIRFGVMLLRYNNELIRESLRRKGLIDNRTENILHDAENRTILVLTKIGL